ncbi:unnamed protein product [Colias eurytheme]|nr:unnamed protein product [Colias eurytheme]
MSRLLKSSDQHYRESCVRPDMPDDVLSKCKEQFLKDLHKTNEELRAIERHTVLQRVVPTQASGLTTRLSWYDVIESNVSKVVKKKQSTSAKNPVKQIIYQRDISHVASVQHGIVCEKIALEQLERQIGQQIRPCGLFIDPEIPFLGATPDGLIGRVKLNIRFQRSNLA